MTHVSHNSGNHEWYTPAHIVEAARQTMGGIDLDPASSEIANQLVKATRFITIEENGITANWGDAQRVWINPPYSQPAIKQFAKKTLCHLDAWWDSDRQAIWLSNNGTETEYGNLILSHAKSVCFPRRRIKFLDGDLHPVGTPLQGQMIVAIGKIDTEEFKLNFEKIGACL